MFIIPTRSAIIQEVERMHVAGLATMGYYYFDFRDVKKQDCDGLLTSLIFSFLLNRIPVTTPFLSYIQIMVAASERQVLARSRNV